MNMNSAVNLKPPSNIDDWKKLLWINVVIANIQQGKSTTMAIHEADRIIDEFCNKFD